MVFVSLIGNGAIGFCMDSADFSFSSDLDMDGYEFDDDDGLDGTSFCWVDVEDWTFGDWKPDCLLAFQILRHE